LSRSGRGGGREQVGSWAAGWSAAALAGSGRPARARRGRRHTVRFLLFRIGALAPDRARAVAHPSGGQGGARPPGHLAADARGGHQRAAGGHGAAPAALATRGLRRRLRRRGPGRGAAAGDQPGTLAIYAGAGDADEEAFAAVNARGGLSVQVGAPSRNGTVARFMVADAGEVIRLVHWLADARRRAG